MRILAALGKVIAGRIQRPQREGAGGEEEGMIRDKNLMACPYRTYMLALAVITMRYWLLHLRILVALGKATAGRIRRPQREGAGGRGVRRIKLNVLTTGTCLH